MRRLATFAVMAGLGLFSAGCSNETQLDRAQDELVEERIETNEAIRDAAEDGLITPSERADIIQEHAETIEQSGEVVEKAGDVIEERTNP